MSNDPFYSMVCGLATMTSPVIRLKYNPRPQQVVPKRLANQQSSRSIEVILIWIDCLWTDFTVTKLYRRVVEIWIWRWVWSERGYWVRRWGKGHLGGQIWLCGCCDPIERRSLVRIAVFSSKTTKDVPVPAPQMWWFATFLFYTILNVAS